MANLNFNAEEHEPLGDFEPIPADDYTASIVESQVKSAKNGQGTYLAHRMPLFSKGPEVLVVRDGIARELLTAKP